MSRMTSWNACLRGFGVLLLILLSQGGTQAQSGGIYDTMDPALRPVPGGEAYYQTFGDPVYPSSGEARLRKVDLEVPSNGFPFSFVRTYRSGLTGVIYNGPLGANWDFNYNMRLKHPGLSGNVTIESFDGSYRSDFFSYNAGTWEAPAGVYDTITYASGIYTRTTKYGFRYEYEELNDGTDRYGRLIRMVDRNGRAQTFSYDVSGVNGKLTGSNDTNGRSYDFSYDTNGYLTLLSDFGTTPRSIKYEYDSSGNLSDVIELPGEVLEQKNSYTYDANHRLLSIIDAKENAKASGSYTPVPFCRNYYNSSGLLIAQEYGPPAATEDTSAPIANAFVFAYEVDLANEVTKTTLYDRGGTEIRLLFDSNGLITSKEWEAGAIDPQIDYEYDANFNLTKTTRFNGDELYYIYDANGNLITARTEKPGSASLETLYEYDVSFNELTRSIDRSGLITDYEYDSQGNLTKGILDPVSGGLSLTTTYQYDLTNGLLVKSTDSRGVDTSYEYTTSNYLKKVTGDSDTGGLQLVSAEYFYDEYGNVLTAKDGRGNETKYTTNRRNQVTKVIDPLLRESEFIYDANENLVTSYSQNSSGTGSGGRVVKMSYDVMDNLTSLVEDVTGATSRTTSYFYDADDQLTKVTLPEGNSTVYEYDDIDLNTKITVAAGTVGASSWEYFYDKDLRLTKTQEPLGSLQFTELSYDYHGRITKSANASGHYIFYDYGSTDRLVSVSTRTSGTGAITGMMDYQYDSANRMTLSRSMIKNTSGVSIGDGWIDSKIVYDANSNVVTMIDESLNETRFTYDSLNRIATTVDAAGVTGTLIYDDNGNLITTSASDGGAVYVTRFEYDALDRVTKTYDPSGEVGLIAFDEIGNVVELEDANGHKSFFDFDELNRVTSARVQYEGTNQLTTQYFYDLNSNLLTLRDPRGKDTKYEYDQHDRMTKESFANLGYREFTYDENSNVLTRRDQNGTKVFYHYDTLNLLTKKTFLAGASHIKGELTEKLFFYDSLNRMTKAEDSDSRVVYAYNSIGLVESEEMQYGVANKAANSGRVVEWDYDDQGRVAHVRYPGATSSLGQLNYTYDGVHRIDTIRRQTTATTSVSIADYDYDGPRLTKRTNGNGTWADYAYDSRGMVTTIKHRKTSGSTKDIVEMEYDYDAAGRTTAEGIKHYDNSGALSEDKGYNFFYDKASRLTKYYEGVPVVDLGEDPPTDYVDLLEYDFDAAGNRLSSEFTPKGGATESQTYSVSSINQYDQVVSGTVTKDYQYDTVGNREGVDSLKTWHYDYQNKLVQVTQNANEWVKYEHDALGRRMEKCWAWDGIKYVSCKRFFYAGNALIQEYDWNDESSSLEFEYIWGLSLAEPVHIRKFDLLAEETSYEDAYYHQSATGSVYALTDAAKDTVENYRYLTYGGATIYGGDTTSTATPFGNKFLWHARYYDLEVEDVTNGARLYGATGYGYDPQIGRDISSGAGSPPAGSSPDPFSPEYGSASPGSATAASSASELWNDNPGKGGGGEPGWGGTPGYGGPDTPGGGGGMTGGRSPRRGSTLPPWWGGPGVPGSPIGSKSEDESGLGGGGGTTPCPPIPEPGGPGAGDDDAMEAFKRDKYANSRLGQWELLRGLARLAKKESVARENTRIAKDNAEKERRNKEAEEEEKERRKDDIVSFEVGNGWRFCINSVRTPKDAVKYWKYFYGAATTVAGPINKINQARNALSWLNKGRKLFKALSKGGIARAAAADGDFNKLIHVFANPKHELEELVNAAGGAWGVALAAVQEAADQALTDGVDFATGSNGVIQGKGQGPILDVLGQKIQLAGGRIMNGKVRLGTFHKAK